MNLTLSFKGILKNVKSSDEAADIVRKLIGLGFTFESDKAYIGHTCRETTAYTVIDTAAMANEEILWGFNFTGGGYNNVMARSLDEAICKASLQFKGMSIEPGTFKPYRTKAEVLAYEKSLPLWD